MRIGALARAAGVSTRALRYYEEQQLIISDRSSSGQRLYSENVVDRVLWIQALYAAGLSSKTIVDLLPGVHTGIASASVVDRLTAERERIESQIRDLIATRDRLDAVIATATDPIKHCPAPAVNTT